MPLLSPSGLTLTLSLLSAAMAWTSASTSGRSADGRLQVQGVDGDAMHTHGGPGAPLGQATFQVRWEGDLPADLTVSTAQILTGHSCDTPPTDAAPLTVVGLWAAGRESHATPSLRLPPRQTTAVTVRVVPVEAYYTHCSRFAFQVTFQADGQSATAVAEIQVSREEPLRQAP